MVQRRGRDSPTCGPEEGEGGPGGVYTEAKVGVEEGEDEGDGLVLHQPAQQPLEPPLVQPEQAGQDRVTLDPAEVIKLKG